MIIDRTVFDGRGEFMSLSFQRGWRPGSCIVMAGAGKSSREAVSHISRHRHFRSVRRLDSSPFPKFPRLPSAYLPKPIGFMYVWLSRNSHSSMMTPWFQCPTVHIGLEPQRATAHGAVAKDGARNHFIRLAAQLRSDRRNVSALEPRRGQLVLRRRPLP